MFSGLWAVGARRGKNRSAQGTRNGAYHRRLVCEPLEDRRLLSATFPSGAFDFIVQAQVNTSGTWVLPDLDFGTYTFEGVSTFAGTAVYDSPTEGVLAGQITVDGVALIPGEGATPVSFSGQMTIADTDGDLYLATAQTSDYFPFQAFQGITGTVDWETGAIELTWAGVDFEYAGLQIVDSGSWAGQITVLPPDHIGVHRDGTFYCDYSGDGRWNPGEGDYWTRFGNPGDIPIIGDWNGDGTDQIGVWRSGVFYLDYNGNGRWDAGDRSYRFGNATDTPIVGDWNGDGADQIGVHRNGTFYFDVSGDGTWNPAAGDYWTRFGNPDDRPIIGDWNGDGTDQIGVHRGGTFYFDYSGDGRWNPAAGDYATRFGNDGDRPIIGDWNGDGADQIGVYRGGTFYFDYSADGRWNPAAGDYWTRFGNPGDIPIIGKWAAPGGQPLHAAGLPADPAADVPALDHDALSPIVFAAIADWTTLLGLGAERLAQVEFVIADLPGTLLGMAEQNTIYLDATAAGFGWFIDPTPELDEEFEAAGVGGGLRAVDSALAERMDLLTVVSHELGHLLGLPDVDPSAGGLMGGALGPGQRFRPGAAERDAYFAALV